MIKSLTMKLPKNTIHLASGSTCPPLQNGNLRIYSMFFCPYAQRTRMVLNAKNVKHETVNVHLEDKPDWFLKLNPLGKVPTLQLNDKVMFESMITCDYLEETYPNPPLYPRDPWAKGVDRCLINVFEAQVIRVFYQFFPGRQDGQHIETIAEKFNSGMDYFEKELAKRGTKFFYEDRPGMLDFALFPWFERIPILRKFFPDQNIFPKDRLPNLTEYYEGMLQDSAVKSTLAKFEDHLEFLETRFAGNTNYDVGASPNHVLQSSNL